MLRTPDTYVMASLQGLTMFVTQMCVATSQTFFCLTVHQLLRATSLPQYVPILLSIPLLQLIIAIVGSNYRIISIVAVSVIAVYIYLLRSLIDCSVVRAPGRRAW